MSQPASQHKEQHKQQTHITKWTEEPHKKGKKKNENETKTTKKQRKKQQRIKMDNLEQEHRSIMGKWLANAGKTKRQRQMPNKDDAPEPTIKRTTREVIQKIQGIIMPVHGDGACWYRAMAKNAIKHQFDS